MAGRHLVGSPAWRWRGILLALAFAIGVVAGPVRAQSTDPNNPSPWPPEGITSGSDGERHTCYYTLEAGPGTLDISVRTQARSFSTSVSVDLFDDRARDSSLRRVGAIATSASPVTEQGSLTLSQRTTLLLVLTIEANCREYNVQIGGSATAPGPGSGPVVGVPVGEAVAWSSLPQGQLKQGGSGRAECRAYYLEAGPGEVTVDLVAVGGAASTRVVAALSDAPGRELASVVATAPAGEQVYQRRTVALPERSRLFLHVTTDANTAHYIVNLRGAVHR